MIFYFLKAQYFHVMRIPRMQCNHVGRCGISLGVHRPSILGAMAGRMGHINLCRVGATTLGRINRSSITRDIVVNRQKNPVKFLAPHTVNCVICKNLSRIEWMLLNFTPVIQQNCHQPGRNFEKSFCANDRLNCQNPRPGTSGAILFLIVNYVHVIFLHGAKFRFEILRYLKSSDFCVAEI